MLKCKKTLSLIMVFVMLSAVIALSAVAVHAEDKMPETDATVSVRQNQDPSEDEDIDDSDYDDEYIDDIADGTGRPEGLPYLFYRISVAADGDGTAIGTVNGESFTGSKPVGKRQDQIDDLIVTLTASSDSGTFTDWTITGSFMIVSGGLNEKVITIRPDSDIAAVANFSDGGDNVSATEAQPTEVKPTQENLSGGKATADEKKVNNSMTSPKTGDCVPMILTVIALTAVISVLAVKKIKE